MRRITGLTLEKSRINVPNGHRDQVILVDLFVHHAASKRDERIGPRILYHKLIRNRQNSAGDDLPVQNYIPTSFIAANPQPAPPDVNNSTSMSSSDSDMSMGI